MRRIIIFLWAVTVSLTAFAQADRKEVRQGNREFRKGEYRQSDVSYRKALLKDSLSLAGNYDLANNLYRQQNFDEASKYISKCDADSPYGADIAFNEGDIAIAKQDWKGAVDAFKRSLLKNPGDLQAKENYIYAKKKLEEQEQQQNQDNQDQDQDNQNQDQNQDQQDQDQDQNQDRQQDQEDQQQQPQPQDQQISPQQAQQMLKAIQAKEKETQDKVNKDKAAALKAAQKDKNW